MSSLVEEGLITLSQAAKLMPRRRQNKAVHSTSIWRWCRYGVKRGNTTVFLEHVDSPSGIATSKEAVARFLVALSKAPTCPAESHQKNNANVSRQLDKQGL